MVALKEGVVYDVPVLKAEPPVAFANQLIVPALAVAPKTTVPFPQRELFVTAVMEGEALTVTAVVTVVLQPGAETTTEYVPAAFDPTFGIVGFWIDDEKLFGPVQAKVNGPFPPEVVTPNCNSVPEQTGPELEAAKLYTVTIPTLLNAVPQLPF